MAVSWWITFKKLSRKLQLKLRKYRIFLDLFSGLSIFITLSAISKSIVSVFAAIAGGLMVDIALVGEDVLDKEPELRHKLNQKVSLYNEMIVKGIRYILS
jgi:hypothetical protein